MKNPRLRAGIATAAIFLLAACGQDSKFQSTDSASEVSEMAVMDSTSIAANASAEGKKFVKNADVNMEVKDVYEATIYIEKQLLQLGGYVTNSDLKSNVVSEKTYETSDTEAVVVKKFQTENMMTVRVPSETLGDFLTFVNNKSVFLNSRLIHAEDVSDQEFIAQLERKKLEKTAEVIDKMKNNAEKVVHTANNLGADNHEQISSLKLKDKLKYSTVELYLREPKTRIAEIPVTNSRDITNKYKINFVYEMKTAMVQGFFMIQKVIVALVSIWPLILIGVIVYWMFRKKKFTVKTVEESSSDISQ